MKVNFDPRTHVGIGDAAEAATLYIRIELRYRDNEDGIRIHVKNNY